MRKLELLWTLLGMLTQVIGLIPTIISLIASYLAVKYKPGLPSTLMIIGSVVSVVMVLFDFYFNNYLIQAMSRNDNFEVIIYAKVGVWMVANTLFAVGFLLFVKQVIKESSMD